MSPTRWQHIQALVEEALQLSPEQRYSLLDDACGTDQGMRRQVAQLIESYENDHSILKSAVEAGAREMVGSWLPAVGDRIGAYQITAEVGYGGMGAVYSARRVDDHFQQTVAIKVLRSGLGSSAELEHRFRAERQILARLTHPNIARLADGGITPAGLPYLVMEYIEGSTIDQFCEIGGLDVSTRIELFRQVCSAVQYAHQNLVVHRDIKPGNILVTRDGVPKLLDFGIAKLLNADVLEEPLPLTRPAERLMTPEYASPEQIRCEPVTTATDVYALGVVLYELVSGVRLFCAANLSPTALERMICETAPERPSLAACHKRRRQGIGTDLDTIVLKALHKEPARRYSSAGELSQDLRRYQQGLPVTARPDSWSYRATCFLSRHKLATAAATLFTLTVTALSIGLALETRRERAETATAKGIADFMVSLLQGFSPQATHGRSINVRDVLDRGAERVPAELRTHPIVEARLFSILGSTYRDFGDFSRAETLLNRAVTIYGRSLGSDSREAAECRLTLAAIASDRGDFHRSGELYREALNTFTRVDGPRTDLAAQAIEGLGEVRRMLGDLKGARERYTEAIQAYTETDGPAHLRTLSARNGLISVLANQSDYASAEILARENLPREKEVLGSTNPNVALTLNLLAYVLGRTARFAEATERLSEALEIQRKVYGAEHPAIALNLTDMSACERELGHYAESKRLAEEALAMSIRLAGSRSLGTANAQGQLGLTQLVLGDGQGAKASLEAALATRRALGNPDNPDLGDNYDRVGLAELALGDTAGAHRDIAKGLEIRQNFYGQGNENVLRSLNHMARVEAVEGAYREAERRYRAAIAIGEASFKTGHTITADALMGLGTALLAEQHPDEARNAFERALEMRRKLLPRSHPSIVEASIALANCPVTGR